MSDGVSVREQASDGSVAEQVVVARDFETRVILLASSA